MNRSTAFIVVLCSFAIKVSFVGTDYYLYHTAELVQIYKYFERESLKLVND